MRPRIIVAAWLDVRAIATRSDNSTLGVHHGEYADAERQTRLNNIFYQSPLNGSTQWVGLVELKKSASRKSLWPVLAQDTLLGKQGKGS